MPMRPRSHELETESRRAFERLLPSAWVSRPIPDDYGIDLEVEIFENGRTTGMTFKVQLKATDAKPKGSSHSVRVDTATITYWRQHDVPVLVALFVANEGAIYHRWAHSYDPHFRRPNGSPKTATFKFNKQHRATANFAANLTSDVSAIRAIRFGQARGPVPVKLSLPLAGSVHGRENQEIRVLFRQAVNAVSTALALAGDDQIATQAYIESTQIRVTIPTQLASITFHHARDYYTSPANRMRLIPDTLLLIATVHAMARMTRSTVEIVRSIDEIDLLPLLPDIAVQVFYAFIDEGDPSGALRIISPLADGTGPDIQGLFQVLMTELIMGTNGKSFSDEDLDRIVELHLKVARRAIRVGNSALAGKVYYSIGEIWRMREEWQYGLDAFELAMTLDPGYSSRPYFYRARAGMRFELQQYELAAEDYRHTLNEKSIPEAGFLLGDSLMHAGKYGEALEVMENSASTPEPYGSQARLHEIALTIVIELTNLREQQRQTISDLDLEMILASELPGTAIDSLIRQDALDGRLWWEVALSSDNPKTMVQASLIAALLECGRPDLWAVHLLLGTAFEFPPEILNDAIDVAYRFTGGSLIEEINKGAELVGQTVTNQLMAILLTRVDKPRLKSERVIRAFSGDGNYTEVVVPDW